MYGDEESAAQTIRGAVLDRAWGHTLGALAVGAQSGRLTLRSDDRVFRIDLDRGTVVAATSPVAADSVARVALTGHLVAPAQVDDLRQRIAAAPAADEVDLVTAAARLSAEQARALRRRLLTQRAARTFSIERGAYELEEREARTGPAEGIDLRAVIYAGARTHLSELRLGLELRQLGTRFALKPGAADDLPRYGFTRTERPVLEALRRGTSLPELEANPRDLDPRLARAVLYTLASCDALMIAESLAVGSGAIPPIRRHITAVGGRAPRPPASPARSTPAAPATPSRLQPRTAPPRTAPPRARPRTLPPHARPRPPVVSPPIPSRPATRARGEPPPLPRSLLDTFRTNQTTTVRPNALAAHELTQLIEERTALLDRGADHFAVLGVAFGAPVEDVHAAYVELSRNLRPARLAELGISDESFAAQRLLAQIGIAFTVLTDRVLRPEYMASLRHP